MEPVKLPRFAKVLMNVEVITDCKNHIDPALRNKTVVRVIENPWTQISSGFIVETDKIALQFVANPAPIFGKISTIETPTKITINDMDGYSIEVELLVDGNMFCVKACGDLQSGIAAFGETVSEAVFHFKQSLKSANPQTFGTTGE